MKLITIVCQNCNHSEEYVEGENRSPKWLTSKEFALVSNGKELPQKYRGREAHFCSDSCLRTYRTKNAEAQLYADLAYCAHIENLEPKELKLYQLRLCSLLAAEERNNRMYNSLENSYHEARDKADAYLRLVKILVGVCTLWGATMIGTIGAAFYGVFG